MKVEKRKDGGFVLRAETGKNTPEEEFIDFLGNICEKVKKNLKSYIWIVEIKGFSGEWEAVDLHYTRKSARACIQGFHGGVRIRKYARI